MSSILGASPYANTPRKEMLKYIPPNAIRILDVGCNTGAFGNRNNDRDPAWDHVNSSGAFSVSADDSSAHAGRLHFSLVRRVEWSHFDRIGKSGQARSPRQVVPP